MYLVTVITDPPKGRSYGFVRGKDVVPDTPENASWCWARYFNPAVGEFLVNSFYTNGVKFLGLLTEG